MTAGGMVALKVPTVFGLRHMHGAASSIFVRHERAFCVKCVHMLGGVSVSGLSKRYAWVLRLAAHAKCFA
jgi:hypothetical protein